MKTWLITGIILLCVVPAVYAQSEPIPDITPQEELTEKELRDLEERDNPVFLQSNNQGPTVVSSATLQVKGTNGRNQIDFIIHMRDDIFLISKNQQIGVHVVRANAVSYTHLTLPTKRIV